MPKANETYSSYLLRFQRAQRDNTRTWSASLASLGTTTVELRQFVNVEALIRFLREEFGEGEGTKDACQWAAQDMPGPRRS